MLRFLLSLSIAAGLLPAIAILPTGDTGFNGAVTGSPLSGVTVGASLPVVNDIQGLKLYLQSPVTGTVSAGSSSIIAILSASGSVGGDSVVGLGTPMTVGWDFHLTRPAGISLTSLTITFDLYTPGNQTVSYYHMGSQIVSGSSLETHFQGSSTSTFFNILEPGAFVVAEFVVQANWTAPNTHDMTLDIPNASLDVNIAPGGGAVPEPATFTTLAGALVLGALAVRRRRAQ